MKRYQKTLPVLAMICALSTGTQAYAGADHDHGHEHGAAQEQPHFDIPKPETAEAAWTLLDDTAAAAKGALEKNDLNALHESGEKLEVAITSLKEKTDLAPEENRKKLASVLGQLGKAIDRLHHAAEDKDIAGAKEALDLIDSLRPMAKPLYTSR